MGRQLPLIAVFCFLSCGPASAKDFYLTAFQGDYETIFAVPPASIVDLGGGVKRADLLIVDIKTLEMEEGVSLTYGTLAVIGFEVNCQAAPRQFKEDSEYVQDSRSDEPFDKTALNPYKDWTPIPSGSGLVNAGEFICRWPEVKPDVGIKREANDEWELVDDIVEIVKQIREKK